MPAGSVIAVTRQRGRGKRSGIESEQLMVAVYTFRDGQVVLFRIYDTKAEALEAVGLLE
ncbi:MAG TPA: hypothetical protein VGS17_07995 [Candidatus Limnocylindria bacterium]|nr:hypothetical protein [Candidatus Limnocylindria bacterium]